MKWSPNGVRLFAGSTEDKLRVWETRSWTSETWSKLGQPVQVSLGHSKLFGRVANASQDSSAFLSFVHVLKSAFLVFCLPFFSLTDKTAAWSGDSSYLMFALVGSSKLLTLEFRFAPFSPKIPGTTCYNRRPCLPLPSRPASMPICTLRWTLVPQSSEVATELR